MDSRIHLGTGYEVWDRNQAWFWFVDDPACNGGAIGTAATEGQAVSEALRSIEELHARRRTARRREVPLASWGRILTSLDRYLNSLCHASGPGGM